MQVQILTEQNIQKNKQITYGYLLSMVGVTASDCLASLAAVATIICPFCFAKDGLCRFES